VYLYIQVRGEIKQLMDDDDDMAEIYFTENQVLYMSELVNGKFVTGKLYHIIRWFWTLYCVIYDHIMKE
jgi:hypothetical protein